MILLNTNDSPNSAESLYSEVISYLEEMDIQQLIQCIKTADMMSISPVLRQLTEHERILTFGILANVEPQLAANLLDHYSDSEIRSLLAHLPKTTTQDIFRFLRSADRRMIIRHFSQEQGEYLNSAFPEVWIEEEKASLNYDVNSAGGICKNEILKLSRAATVSHITGILADDEQNYEHQEWRYIYLHNEDGSYLGAIKLKDIFSLPYGSYVKDYLDETVPVATADISLFSLKSILDTTPHSIIPVVDQDGFQIGIVGFKQLNEALYRESKTQLLEQSGVFGGDEFRTMPTVKRNIRRLTFLLPSVVLSYAAVSIIAQFESIISQFALLAAILPLVANLSGAAGNQAVAVSIRELSVGSLTPKDVLYVILKELPIGIINGVIIGAVLSILSFITYGSELITLPILVSFAYVISSTFAVVIGGALPLTLKRLNLDPAMLSSPLLTTLTDAMSFFSVLYLAQLFLL
ncbi:magnesium transporter [Vibrio ulleungensis]|uniref:Magnesium transporter n=1 Tax=Vibrio ulleungensis TaxID=2807619 RepID=A0ABS2HF64_9VIBR|nr:magnesium transporter [Vibrio ulleungensis]MBM7035286.1 magnesium transporter [Vibrio ulleungensis]